MSLLDDSVTETDDGRWTFQCPGVKGDRCGDLVAVEKPKAGEPGFVLVPFSSSGWPTKKSATARGRQHFDDHKLGAEIQQAMTAAVAEAGDPTEVDREAIRARVIEESKFAVTQEMSEFLKDQGLVVNDDGSVSVKDL